jgi:hypothetical protein
LKRLNPNRPIYVIPTHARNPTPTPEVGQWSFFHGLGVRHAFVSGQRLKYFHIGHLQARADRLRRFNPSNRRKFREVERIVYGLRMFEVLEELLGTRRAQQVSRSVQSPTQWERFERWYDRQTTPSLGCVGFAHYQLGRLGIQSTILPAFSQPHQQVGAYLEIRKGRARRFDKNERIK